MIPVGSTIVKYFECYFAPVVVQTKYTTMNYVRKIGARSHAPHQASKRQAAKKDARLPILDRVGVEGGTCQLKQRTRGDKAGARYRGYTYGHGRHAC